MIPRRLRPAPPTADATCKVCGAWMRLPRAASARERAISAGFFWAGHQHEALDPIIDEVEFFRWDAPAVPGVDRSTLCEWSAFPDRAFTVAEPEEES